MTDGYHSAILLIFVCSSVPDDEIEEQEDKECKDGIKENRIKAIP